MSSMLENTLTLPFLKVLSFKRRNGVITLLCCTRKRPMACPTCAAKCEAAYDQRVVTIRDQKIRNFHVVLKIHKRRYFCKRCKKPKTEPLDGILPRRRTTQRFRRWIMQLCRHYSNMEAVCREAQVSRDFSYRAFYEQLELETRKTRNPWPKAIGIDEHAFKRRRCYGGTAFASLIVSHNNRRPIELVEGRTSAALEHQLAHLRGRENVRWVTLDLCDPFKNFAKNFFPNAQLVADPFHVLRLLNPALNRARKEITGDRRTLKVRRLILRSRKRLEYLERYELHRFLERHPELEEIYEWKERLHGFYRIRGHKRAERALIAMLDEMAFSRSKPIQTLRRTLQRWKTEILAHFKCRLTNARAEGFNNVAKTIKKQAYGFRSFKNYRLRLLTA